MARTFLPKRSLKQTVQFIQLSVLTFILLEHGCKCLASALSHIPSRSIFGVCTFSKYWVFLFFFNPNWLKSDLMIKCGAFRLPWTSGKPQRGAILSSSTVALVSVAVPTVQMSGGSKVATCCYLIVSGQAQMLFYWNIKEQWTHLNS